MLRLLSLFLLCSTLVFAQSGGSINGSRGFPKTEDTVTGVTQYGTAVIVSGSAIQASTSNTGVNTYIVLSPTSNAPGYATLASQGTVAPCTMDSTIGGGADNYYVINSTTTAGQCHAQSTLPAYGVWVIGFLQTSSTTQGATSPVEVVGFLVAALPIGTEYGITYYTPTGLGNTTVPATNGQYLVGYNVTNSATVTPAPIQTGFTVRAISGSTATDTILTSDNNEQITQLKAATGVLAESLPTPTSLGNNNFGFEECADSPNSITLTPMTYTVNGGSSLIIASGTCYVFTIDPSGNNWLAHSSAAIASSSSSSFSTLTDAATVNWALSGSTPINNAMVTLAGNRTLNITGLSNGAKGTLLVTQDGTGSRTLALPAGSLVEGNGAGVITLTTAGGVDG